MDQLSFYCMPVEIFYHFAFSLLPIGTNLLKTREDLTSERVLTQVDGLFYVLERHFCCFEVHIGDLVSFEEFNRALVKLCLYKSTGINVV